MSMTKSVQDFLADRSALMDEFPSVPSRDYVLVYPPSRAAIAQQMHKCARASALVHKLSYWLTMRLCARFRHLANAMSIDWRPISTFSIRSKPASSVTGAGACRAQRHRPLTLVCCSAASQIA